MIMLWYGYEESDELEFESEMRNMFGSPALLMRKRIILKKLEQNGAISEETAKTLEEIGVFNPNAFSKLNDKLVKDKILIRTKTDKYYLNR